MQIKIPPVGALPHDHPAAPPIKVTDLCVTFGGGAVLQGVNLTVQHGETLAILGHNGSGKSTLIKALVGINVASRGSIELFGVDITRRAAQVAWSHIGYVPQRVTQLPPVPATALEVVAAGLLHPRQLRYPRRWRERALAALDAVDMAARAHDPVHVFSGGQTQRVLIARALVRPRELLLLDEPMAGLDQESQEKLATTLGDIKQFGHTIVLVLHETAGLAGIIDRSVTVVDGQIVAGAKSVAASHCGRPDAP